MELPRIEVLLLLVLLLLMVPGSADSTTIAFTHRPGLSDDPNLADQVVTSLVSGPLQDQDLLVVTDDPSQWLLDLNKVMAAAGASETRPLLLATQSSILQSITQSSTLRSTWPPHHTKGSLLTAILLIYSDPVTFLVSLESNRDWNPGYLVIFSLNSQLNITTILSLPVVQRAEFLLFIFPALQAGQPTFQTFTGVPTRHGVGVFSLKIVSMGIWNPEKFSSRQLLFPPRFKDFDGYVMRVPALCYNEPFLYYKVHGEECFGGGLDALQMISEKLNFETLITFYQELIWSDKENGTWKGLLGRVMYEKQSLMINSYKMTEYGFNDFDTTYPHWEGGYSFIIRVPLPLAKWRNVLYPFSTVVWGSVFVTMVIVATFLALLLNTYSHVKDPTNIALKVGAGLLNQPMDDRGITSAWARVLLIVWWFSVDLLAAGYTSNLVAVLTMPVIPPRIQTVEDLAASSIRPCAGDIKDFLPQALKTSNNPTLAYLGQHLLLEPIHTNEDPYKFLMEKVVAGSCAVINMDHYLETMRTKKKLTQNTYIMTDHIYNGYLSWYLNLHTPYTRTLSVHMHHLVESGIYLHLYHVHVGAFQSNTGKQIRSEAVLNLEHLQSAFIVLALGALVAAVVFLLEKCQQQ